MVIVHSAPGTLSGNSIENWLTVNPQFCNDIVHFLAKFLIAKYMVLHIASSVEKVERFFVALRSWLFRLSIALVV
jgi:hypothetical protein